MVYHRGRPRLLGECLPICYYLRGQREHGGKPGMERRTQDSPQTVDSFLAERCTIIVTPRDLFSTTKECLEAIFRHTPEPFDLLVVMGGAPDSIQAMLESRY